MRRLIVGDIHGCFEEFQELLDRTGLAADDEIISLGDLVDRGPDSPRVVEFFRRRPGVRSLRGNHEQRHLRIARGEIKPAPSQVLTRRQFSMEEYAGILPFFASLPFFLDLPDALLVHGAFEPARPVSGQRPETLLGLMSAESFLQRRYPRPWYELYDGDKPLVAGHHDYSKEGRPLVIRDRVFLIDTGCCYGKALTGLVLPDFRLVSVRAMRNHWGIALQGHPEFKGQRERT